MVERLVPNHVAASIVTDHGVVNSVSNAVYLMTIVKMAVPSIQILVLVLAKCLGVVRHAPHVNCQRRHARKGLY
jgi:hypothetical protein